MSLDDGKLAAHKHHREKGFSISRYDFPIVRTGLWPHDEIYKHFGIKEGADPFGSLEFYKGWNAEMDRLLLARYGSEYQKYRREVIPAPDAKVDEMMRGLLQPAGGF